MTRLILKGKRSRVFSIKQGVRQGAILSPLLYSVYVDALLVQLDECCLGAMVGSVHCPSPMYADDLFLIAVKLQSLLDIVQTMLVPGVMRSILQSLQF